MYCRLSRFLLAQRAAGLSLCCWGGYSHRSVLGVQVSIQVALREAIVSIFNYGFVQVPQMHESLVMKNEEEDNCNQS